MITTSIKAPKKTLTASQRGLCLMSLMSLDLPDDAFSFREQDVKRFGR